MCELFLDVLEAQFFSDASKWAEACPLSAHEVWRKQLDDNGHFHDEDGTSKRDGRILDDAGIDEFWQA